MSAKPQTLRDRQIGMTHRNLVTESSLIDDIASIEHILTLNRDASEANGADEVSSDPLSSPTKTLINENGEPLWKILVFDDLGRDIISSVLKVNDLRALGVTIHL